MLEFLPAPYFGVPAKGRLLLVALGMPVAVLVKNQAKSCDLAGYGVFHLVKLSHDATRMLHRASCQRGSVGAKELLAQRVRGQTGGVVAVAKAEENG